MLSIWAHFGDHFYSLKICLRKKKKLKQKVKIPKTLAWQFSVTFLGWLSEPLKWLSDLQLGNEKLALNHLGSIFLRNICSCIFLASPFHPVLLGDFSQRIREWASSTVASFAATLRAVYLEVGSDWSMAMAPRMIANLFIAMSGQFPRVLLKIVEKPNITRHVCLLRFGQPYDTRGVCCRFVRGLVMWVHRHTRTSLYNVYFIHPYDNTTRHIIQYMSHTVKYMICTFYQHMYSP